MTRTRAVTIVALLVVSLAGCAGRNFVRPDSTALRLGQTTADEIRQRLGSPYRTGEVVKNGVRLRTASYAYASGGAALVGGVTPARALGFYFLDGVLVGYEFTSSYADDTSDYDESKVSQIAKGETTRAQVVAVLGQPGGLYRYPLIKGQTDTGLVYLYSQTRGTAFNLKLYQKLLVVSVDDHGVVTESSSRRRARGGNAPFRRPYRAQRREGPRRTCHAFDRTSADGVDPMHGCHGPGGAGPFPVWRDA